ncbi:hypothetical protein HN51_033594 [Arachis hypogaea]
MSLVPFILILSSSTLSSKLQAPTFLSCSKLLESAYSLSRDFNQAPIITSSTNSSLASTIGSEPPPPRAFNGQPPPLLRIKAVNSLLHGQHIPTTSRCLSLAVNHGLAAVALTQPANPSLWQF